MNSCQTRSPRSGGLHAQGMEDIGVAGQLNAVEENRCRQIQLLKDQPGPLARRQGRRGEGAAVEPDRLLDPAAARVVRRANATGRFR